MGFDADGGKGSVQPVILSVKGTEYLQIFPTQYTQTNSNALIGSPSEGGQQQIDNKVRQPIKIQFTGVVKYSNRSTVTDIRARMKSMELDELKCIFQTKAGRAENMLIETFEEIGDSNRYDGIEIKVSLLEYLEHNAT